MTVTKRKTDRRRRDAFIVIDRRKGRVRMFAELAVCALLVGYLVWLIR
jgi:hypothetical protein